MGYRACVALIIRQLELNGIFAGQEIKVEIMQKCVDFSVACSLRDNVRMGRQGR